MKFTKIEFMERVHGKPIGELIAERRIGRNMKVLDVCADLGISRRTYRVYVPPEIVGETRIEDEVDRRMKQAKAAHARAVKLAKHRNKKRPEKSNYHWRNDMMNLFNRKQKSPSL